MKGPKLILFILYISEEILIFLEIVAHFYAFISLFFSRIPHYLSPQGWQTILLICFGPRIMTPSVTPPSVTWTALQKPTAWALTPPQSRLQWPRYPPPNPEWPRPKCQRWHQRPLWSRTRRTDRAAVSAPPLCWLVRCFSLPFRNERPLAAQRRSDDAQHSGWLADLILD